MKRDILTEFLLLQAQLIGYWQLCYKNVRATFQNPASYLVYFYLFIDLSI